MTVSRIIAAIQLNRLRILAAGGRIVAVGGAGGGCGPGRRRRGRGRGRRRASRRAAKGGEILVANMVRELAKGKDFLFADRGETALKGFDDPVRLFGVRWGE